MKRLLALLLCAVIFCGMLSGCNQEEAPYIPTGDALDDGSGNSQKPNPNPPEQNLTLIYYPNRSMNPYTATDYTNRVLFPLLYQGLFSVDRDYNVSPILCESYRVSADTKTYTFFPAKAMFSDGTALTAQDVVASLNAAKAGTYYKGRFQHIKSIQAEGESVVIKLDTAFENLPLLLDIPIVKASEVDAANPLGTGPYVMDTSLNGRRLRRQAAWWCANQAAMVVNANYIPLVNATSPSQIRDQFEFADVGLVCTDPGSDTYADYRGDHEIWECENGLFLYLVCHKDSPVFSNDTVRRALTYAIDRDYLVENYYRKYARSATLPASPDSPYYNAELANQYSYNSQKFTDALTNANMQGAAVTMLINADDSLRLRVGRQIAKMLTACGLEVTLTEVSSQRFVEYLRFSTYDLYLGQTKLSPNMDLSPFFKTSGSLSYGGLADPVIYEMAKEALANQGNFYNLHKLVLEDAQLCPILTRSYAVYATRGLVTELNPARDNLFYYHLGKTMADALETSN